MCGYSDLGNTTKFLRTDNIDNAAKTLWPKIEESSSYDFTWIPNSGTGITSGAQARVIGFYSNNNYESQMVLTYLTSAPISQREKINGSWGKWKVFVTKSDLDASVKTTNLSAGKDVRLFVGKLNDSQNYLQFLIDGVDKGYIVFDVSRNINT